MTEIIIPIKELSAAKQRLAGLLNAAERAALVLAMLQDLLGSVTEADCSRVLIVASDNAVFDIAGNFGASPVREHEVLGYNAAVTLGLAEARGENVAVLPGDIPLVSAHEINCLCAPADRHARCIRLAASHDRLGTNGLFLASRDLIRPGFGLNSFARYQQTARSAGIETTLLDALGLAQDIDTPRDLCKLAQRARNGATFDFLEQIRDRLKLSDLDRGAA